MLLTVYCYFLLILPVHVKKFRRGQGAPVFVEGGRLCHGTMASPSLYKYVCNVMCNVRGRGVRDNPPPKCSLHFFLHYSATIVQKYRIFFTPKAFCDTQKVLKRCLRLGLHPAPCWRAHDAPPSRLGTGIPPSQSPLPRHLRRLDIGAVGAGTAECN